MKDLKRFYSHIWIFIIVTILIYVTRFLILPSIGILPEDERFIDWLNWNTYLIPAMWALGIGIHGFIVFRLKIKLLKGWEERKIKELMQDEEQAQHTLRKN